MRMDCQAHQRRATWYQQRRIVGGCGRSVLGRELVRTDIHSRSVRPFRQDQRLWPQLLFSAPITLRELVREARNVVAGDTPQKGAQGLLEF